MANAMNATGLGDYRRLESSLERALEFGRLGDDLAVLALAETHNELIAAVPSPSDAIELCDQAVTHATRAGAPRIERLALAWCAIAHLTNNQPDLALKRLSAAPPSSISTAGFHADDHFISFSIAAAHFYSGRLDQAEREFEELEGLLPEYSWDFTLAARGFIAAEKGDADHV
jgi:tetratricopeptide (TPR) repeat protein